MQAMPAEHPVRRRPSWKQFLAVAVALVRAGRWCRERERRGDHCTED